MPLWLNDDEDLEKASTHRGAVKYHVYGKPSNQRGQPQRTKQARSTTSGLLLDTRACSSRTRHRNQVLSVTKKRVLQGS
jgi:hypothetical protein